MNNCEKEILETIKAREELERRGYTRETCQHCRGLGFTFVHQCLTCKGKGFKWKAPIYQ